MTKRVEACKLIGRLLEESVAMELRTQGYTVFQDVYVLWNPCKPEKSGVSQIDVVAVNDAGILAIECKNVSGRIRGEATERTWPRRGHNMPNPLKQSDSHRSALWTNLHVPIHELIVFSDRALYQGPEDRRVVYRRDLQEGLRRIPKHSVLTTETRKWVEEQLAEFANPNGETRRRHLITVNQYRNKLPVAAHEKGLGVEYYCIMVGEYYYAFTDDQGVHWGSEKMDEAMLFETEAEVLEQSSEIEGATPCTLAFGFLESIGDPSDEMDGMTPEEYAYAVGARPW